MTSLSNVAYPPADEPVVLREVNCGRGYAPSSAADAPRSEARTRASGSQPKGGRLPKWAIPPITKATDARLKKDHFFIGRNNHEFRDRCRDEGAPGEEY